MNKHTLNYHTRLHDWYRQHSILQEKQQQQQQHEGGGLKGPPSEAGVGTLTQDKLHFIHDWCTDVNKTLFRIKKKESPPLFRRCRLSANSSSESISKSADPRRIRSAEVFTYSGQNIKEAKAALRGGELLPHDEMKTSSHKWGDVMDVEPKDRKAPGIKADTEILDLCVRNSKDGDMPSKVLPRVNHDSLNLRSNAWILRHNGCRPPERGPHSPRGSASNIDKTSYLNNRITSTAGRAKSATPHLCNNRKHGASTKDQRQSQKEIELLNNAKNKEYSRQMRMRTSSQRSLSTTKSEETITASDGRGKSIQPLINIEGADEINNAVPTFCKTCSDFYSGAKAYNTTPVACGKCIHGININSSGSQDLAYIDPKDLEKAGKRLAEKEKKLDKEITKADIEVKIVEQRLTDDSTHYNSERTNIRQASATRGDHSLTHTLDDIEDERNVSFSNMADDESDNMPSARSAEIKESLVNSTSKARVADERGRQRIAKVTIQTAKDNSQHKGMIRNSNSTTDKQTDANLESEDATAPDPGHLQAARLQRRRSSSRQSISFTFKPTIGNISVSNSLLHVLSIDDCKVNMRYSPHKVLAEHEVTDNFMVPLELTTSGNFSLEKAGETTSKVAMRVSKDSSSVTSLQSSIANDATRTNKKQYRMLYDPEDIDFYKNKRPSSASLAKAFNTLVHDRTIMQRLDQIGSAHNTKSKRAVTCTYEGPGYRRINAALRKQMGEVLQEQRSQLRNKYERQRSAPIKGKTKKGGLSFSPSSHSSLSLESLPVAKRGILKRATANAEKDDIHNSSLENTP